MRARNRLSPAFLRKAPMGKYCDGAGLWLIVRNDGGAQWVLRVTVHGRRREMGLGGYPEIGLAKAREIADRWRAMAKDGRDPIKEREREIRAARREDISLAIITADAFEARKAELKGDGTAGRWLSPLTLHVLPKLGKVPVTDLDQRDIRDTLAPIWHTKADTARKALNRLSIVLRHAAALGLDVDLQATDKAKALLGKSRHKPKNIPAMDWRDVPGFYANLEEPTLTHLALRLLILTGVRSGPLRNLRIEQIEGDVWTVPAEAMKGRKGATDDFRVPLSAEAQRVIDLARPHARNGYLFPNTRGGVISDMTLSRHMERKGLEARPHGFRTSLRTWLAEATDAPHEVAEAMLAHVVDGGVVRAYRRTDYLEQRAKLAERWADHVTGGAGQVVKLAGAAK
ncbi:integrase arm-type DNA-binding domain-containing protein [Lutimaribacter sp. EGI FJ00015]|uniref:Integrase arm-type DNA-binding domain-containing protein n=1 Tax=Lutimaribacter degradans TaxID=2945989 RepID=A0ACC5ZU61_9RHOB|nr:site-specific integrase [Lutimaribacter sp. EGI FJ00013]MCM2560924.1 integrase arm-type DNA-binding domain-containing protein [Lutimaribacter sp. EGI FJ00013]MCO0612130.1 integrase arm-type DNA-binding domain-containing protein [Lutimaribacter sp. EGI FJ00015]MCO0634750.1 integrase arm-type DNA-binding domain-containing protein [Lutimaribacter sp. EGI FJ00014]